METLKAHARTKSTEVLTDAIKMIGGGSVSTELRMSRCAMLNVIEERNGGDAVDSLMDIIGL